MVLGQGPQKGQLPPHRTRMLKVGVDHQQALLADFLAHPAVQFPEVRLRKSRLDIVQQFHDGLDLGGTVVRLTGRADLVRKGRQPCFVAIFQRDIGKHQAAVDCVIQQAESIKGHLHHPSQVYDGIHGLCFFLLEMVGHGLARLGRGLPVEVAEVIAHDIGFDLLKLSAVAKFSELFQPIFSLHGIEGQKLVFPHLEEGGVYLDGLAVVEAKTPGDKSQGSVGKEVQAAKAVLAPQLGSQEVMGFAAFTRCQVGKISKVPFLELLGYFVEDKKADGKPVPIGNGNPDLVGVAVGKLLGKDAASLDATLFPKHQQQIHEEQRRQHAGQKQRNRI